MFAVGKRIGSSAVRLGAIAVNRGDELNADRTEKISVMSGCKVCVE
jgi:hypothetical protein